MDQASTLILAISLIIIMLGMGLSLVFADFRRVFLYPKAVVIGLLNQLILLPLIAFGVTMAFPTRPEIAVGLMILAACPGGPTSNLIAHLAKADTALSVTLTALSSFITLLTIPFIVNFSLTHFLEAGQVIKLDVVNTIVQILVIVIIPVTIGMLIRRYKEGFAMKMERPVRIASGIVLMLVIVGLVIKEKDNIMSYMEEAGLVALMLNIATMVVGYLSARMLNINKKMARSISIESGIQNGTLAITIAVVLLGSTEYAITAAVYSLIMFASGGVVIYAGTRGGNAPKVS
ncbi:MAG: bile acid:sodium symporter family protein [Roseivirga sp.]|nr:bile acid:sodium symporter family protein [Roseivirga sp.]